MKYNFYTDGQSENIYMIDEKQKFPEDQYVHLGDVVASGQQLQNNLIGQSMLRAKQQGQDVVATTEIFGPMIVSLDKMVHQHRFLIYQCLVGNRQKLILLPTRIETGGSIDFVDDDRFVWDFIEQHNKNASQQDKIRVRSPVHRPRQVGTLINDWKALINAQYLHFLPPEKSRSEAEISLVALPSFPPQEGVMAAKLQALKLQK